MNRRDKERNSVRTEREALGEEAEKETFKVKAGREALKEELEGKR